MILIESEDTFLWSSNSTVLIRIGNLFQLREEVHSSLSTSLAICKCTFTVNFTVLAWVRLVQLISSMQSKLWSGEMFSLA